MKLEKWALIAHRHSVARGAARLAKRARLQILGPFYARTLTQLLSEVKS